MDDNQSTAVDEIKQLIKGDVDTSQVTRDFYSHDASLFELHPSVVVFPKDVEDVCRLVKYVDQHKKNYPHLSLTGRGGGTDMSGGAINDSIVVVFERYFNNIGPVQTESITVQPGAYYHDFESLTLKEGLLLPPYPASRELCCIGGMVANNAGGEKSLIYGKTDRYVRQLKMVLRDGQEHSFQPLDKVELQAKLQEKSLEGDIYRHLHELVNSNGKILASSKPQVSKNSTGYNLWDVWDGETFDITKVIVGSQGTLGLLTETTFHLVPAKPLSGMVVIYLPNLENLGEVINTVLPLKPSSLESFDDHTLKFAFRFFFSFRKTLGWGHFVLLGLSLIPVLRHLLRYLPKLPKIIMLCEFEGNQQADIDAKIQKLQTTMQDLGIETQVAKNKHQEAKFWTIRRESFNLLRKNVKKKYAAPFIDDLIVPPESLTKFLPRLTEILQRHQLVYAVAGHMGDGNFHIIPLMDLKQETERAKIYPILKEVTDLVLEYHGSLSGEHNDGLIRGPMLEKMYQPEVMQLMRQVKHIFDPDNLFNPHKKTDATMEFSKKHLRVSFKP